MSVKRRIIDSHAHLACKMLGHLDEGAGHMFKVIPQKDVEISEMELWGGIDYYEEYTRAGFPGERMWPDEIWERGERDSEFKKAMTSADSKWMGNRCQKNTFWNLRKILDDNQVDYTCILPIWPANNFEEYWAAHQLDRRMLPFTAIYYPEMDVDKAINKLMKDVEMGAKGLKLHPILQNMDIKSDYVRKVLAAWAETGLPVVSHCGNVDYGTDGTESPNYGNPEFLADLVLEMPEVKFVGAHCGGCRSWEAEYFANRVGKAKNLWVDTSFRTPSEIAWMVEAFGEDKVLFGTDVPFADMDVSIRNVEKAPINGRIREKIFYGNSSELLGIDL